MTILIDNPHVIDGWQAYFARLPEHANPFLFEANPHRLWHYGYCLAKLIDLFDQGILELPGDVGENGELRRLEKSPFAQGQVAYAKGIAISDGPYGHWTQDGFDWRSGWFWQENHCPRLPLEAKPQPVERLSWLAWFASLWQRLKG